MNITERINRLINKPATIKEVKGETTEEKAQTFFSKVYGYDKIKNNLYRALISDEQINTLLFGSPAGGKSMFMKVIEESCNNVFYFDASNASSAGLIEELYRHQDAKILLIDEIGMLKRNDLDALRGLLNDGRIIKTLKKTRYDFTLKNIKVFATSNDLDLPKPIRSRFVEYHLPSYSDEQFVECVRFCLGNKFLPETSAMIANVLIANKTKDVRKAIAASRYIQKNDSVEQIVEVIETMIECAPKVDTDYN